MYPLFLREISTWNIEPNFAGVKNTLEWNWWEDIAYLKFGADLTFYYFRSKGTAQALTRSLADPNAPPDLGDSSLFQAVPVDFFETNVLYSSFLENTFEWRGLKVVPGIRVSYLQLSDEITLDPRVLIGYTFDWEMVASGSYGLYTSYPQLNYFRFNQLFNQQPDIARSTTLKAEKAQHISLGLEQKFGLFSVKAEGFYNIFRDQVTQNPNPQAGAVFVNSAESTAYGFELFLRLDREERKNTFYGWGSYTFTRSQTRTNLPGGTGRTYFPTAYEQPHSFKMILGYRWGKNNIGSRFTLTSGFPYTPTVSSRLNDRSDDITRYSPVYGELFSDRFPISHRLDIRYSYTSSYELRGFRWLVDWFIEVKNIYYWRPISAQNWNYNNPFSEGGAKPNPEFLEDPASFLLPNFGVEIKF